MNHPENEDEYGEPREAPHPIEEEQLALADEDERLPWLESEDDYEDNRGVDMRIVGLAVVGLLVVAALLVGGWWLARDDGESGDVVADGSTIEAPATPYKQRPDDPGGSEVAGTGDTAYEVAEGQSRRGRIAESDDGTPRPSIDREQAGAASASGGEDEGEDQPAPANAVYVQIGAYTSRADADSAWGEAVRRYEVLSGKSHRVAQGTVNGATVYRLQAITGDRASGEATCRAIRDNGGDCYLRN
ncbi:SPOR domain-containing protein [Aurantiacibacter spongiae]|uniref:SPOR domain-containing protein n=1 Tax=Aurantiacibacter spongiae TaxID=2488860 RepID=A0A3N5CZ75_9SPHN|nr:SPOR domain-containing protein [Aurantiacibacter spongiae]RPF72019.1 SPOR domain-containing protein [Aurantiacibacter spongiae]